MIRRIALLIVMLFSVGMLASSGTVSAAPTLGFSAAKARSRVAAHNWCRTHEKWHLALYPFDILGKQKTEQCLSYGIVGSCIRAHFWRRERLVSNPRRISCRVVIRWYDFPVPFTPYYSNSVWGTWHCEDNVDVWVTTRKPYTIHYRRHRTPHCVHTHADPFLAARRR